MIAGVIYNRLKLGMTLGIDATLLYDDPTPDGQLERLGPRVRQPVQHASQRRACRRRRSRARARVARGGARTPRTRRLPLLRAVRRGRASRSSARPRPSTRPTGSGAVSEPRMARARRERLDADGRRDRVAGRRTACRRRSTTRRSPRSGWTGSTCRCRSRRAELRRRSTGSSALGFAGANVTMPHKTRVAELIERPVRGRATPPSRQHDRRRTRTGSRVTTPTRPASIGSSAATRDSTRPGGRRCCSGPGERRGPARCALARVGLAKLAVAVREPSRADDLRAALEGLGHRGPSRAVRRGPDVEADLIVNATPLGVHGEALPLPPLGAERRRSSTSSTGPARHPLQTAARARGRRRLRRPRSPAAAGGPLVRAVDRAVGAARGDVGGGAGRLARPPARSPATIDVAGPFGPAGRRPQARPPAPMVEMEVAHGRLLALAASLAATSADVRGCLILSRDGLVLGAHPRTADDRSEAGLAALRRARRARTGLRRSSAPRSGATSAEALTRPSPWRDLASGPAS